MKVTFHADALRDNRPGEEHLVLRQNQEMMRTKGKGFNKLKQKNKNKFYGAGVDLSVRAYQFPDSDDE
ncbi:SRP40 C-terminal domain containing protein [Lotmaria passim]